MRIREIWMKNFGRFADRRITVNDGIQLFYGENEAGKSTIHTFLKGMLFGMEQKRGRASATDESHLYEPWKNPNYYAGVLRFEAGGKTFCLQRSFEKTGRKAELFCEEDGEEFSVENGRSGNATRWADCFRIREYNILWAIESNTGCFTWNRASQLCNQCLCAG